MDSNDKVAEALRDYDRILYDGYIYSRNAIRNALRLCDSPIEQLFLLAFLNQFGDSNEDIYIPTSATDVGRFFFFYGERAFACNRGRRNVYSCVVQGQHTIVFGEHRFRTDFFFHLFKTTSGDAVTEAEARIAVELDGHDYHERTKEQAERDRSRDRAFIKEGIRVLRFTGREVYRDPVSVAREVHALIEKSIPKSTDEDKDAR